MARPKRSITEKKIKEIKRQTRKKYSSEEKIRIVLDGLRGEYSIAEICRREVMHANLYLQLEQRLLRGLARNV